MGGAVESGSSRFACLAQESLKSPFLLALLLPARAAPAALSADGGALRHTRENGEADGEGSRISRSVWSAVYATALVAGEHLQQKQPWPQSQWRTRAGPHSPLKFLLSLARRSFPAKAAAFRFAPLSTLNPQLLQSTLNPQPLRQVHSPQSVIPPSKNSARHRFCFSVSSKSPRYECQAGTKHRVLENTEGER